ncbi:MAG: LemA family protein, partial [Bradymonadaceae bacterium]
MPTFRYYRLCESDHHGTFFRNNVEIEQLLFPIIAGVGAFVSLFLGYKAFWRKRLIENVPTSKCEGVCIGLTELYGEALSRRPLRSYIAEQSVVYYRFTVEEHWRRRETYTDSKGNRKTRTRSGWRTVRSGEQRPRFQLRDDTGQLRIDPDKAEIDPDQIFTKTCTPLNPLYYGKGPRGAIANSTFRRRFREWAILPQQSIYVLGTARVREDIVEPEIAHDPDAKIFLISTKNEDQIIRKYTWQSVLGFIFAVLLATFFAPIYVASIQEVPFGQAIGETILWMVAAGASFAFVIGVLYLKTIYNGLIDLRHRSLRAWSMIDIELKRRHDLIPNLANIVEGLVEHERGTLVAVANQRTMARIGQTPTAEGTNALAETLQSQSAALGQVFMLAEAYPNLQSDQAFHKLTKELTKCENKLALARTFYNDSVTNLNTRVETFPDMIFAG